SCILIRSRTPMKDRNKAVQPTRTGASMETNAVEKRDRRRVSRIPRALLAAGHRAGAPITVPGALSVPIDKVERDPDQPRHDWRHAEGYQRLNELTQSIVATREQTID